MRTLRHRDSGDTPPRESLADAAERITAEQGRAQLDALLGELVVHPVFTAHPTEARRRAVVASLRRIGGLLASVDDDLAREVETGNAMSARGAELRRRLREEIDLLWRTAQLRVAGMTPLDEVRTVMTAFDETLFRLVPSVYRSLDQVLLGPASGAAASPVPPFLRFGSWVGGDRDGNPTVTAAITREAAVIQAEHALRALEAACGRIGRALTVDERSAPPSDALRRALAAASAAHPELMAEITARSPGEPYRAYLLYAAERLTATRTRNADLAYGSPAEFVADLRLVQASLADAGAVRQAYGELQHLIWQAETFGFHLASLEVRQHSAVHARALAELRAGGELSPMTLEVLETIRVIGWIQNRFGFAACHRYVISFTTAAADVAAVYELAGYAFPDGGGPVLDVVPLFESGDDLAAAPSVLTGMLELAPVRERLAANGRQLEVMLGYSDSAKELGPASATLRLFEAQAELASWAAAHDVALTLFHGRGGAIGRGGGPGRRGAGAGARVGVRAAEGDRAGRGDLRPVRPALDRPAAPGAGDVGGAARLVAVPGRAERRRGGRVPRAGVVDRRRREVRVPRAGGGRRLRRVVRDGQPAGGDRRPADRLAAVPARSRRRAARPGGPARHPLGVRLGADPAEPARAGTASAAASRRRRGPASRRATPTATFPRRGSPSCAARTRSGRCSPPCSTTPRCRWPRPTARSPPGTWTSAAGPT